MTHNVNEWDRVTRLHSHLIILFICNQFQFVSMFTIGTGIFDIYCLAMAAPGSTHYGYFLISYEFVYVGNTHGKKLRGLVLCIIFNYLCYYLFTVRNALIMFALFSLLLAVVIFFTSILLVVALRKEYEDKIVPWLWSFGAFTIIRLLAFLFFAIVNDLIFAYNILMLVMWIALLPACAYSWLVIYSLYIELSDLTRLEDLAHLRVSKKKR